jgi:hypothetical protein
VIGQLKNWGRYLIKFVQTAATDHVVVLRRLNPKSRGGTMSMSSENLLIILFVGLVAG